MIHRWQATSWCIPQLMSTSTAAVFANRGSKTRARFSSMRKPGVGLPHEHNEDAEDSDVAGSRLFRRMSLDDMHMREDAGEWRPIVIQKAAEVLLHKSPADSLPRGISPYSDIGDTDLDGVEEEYKESLAKRAAEIRRVLPLAQKHPAEPSGVDPSQHIALQKETPSLVPSDDEQAEEEERLRIAAAQESKLRSRDGQQAVYQRKSAEQLLDDYNRAAQRLQEARERSPLLPPYRKRHHVIDGVAMRGEIAGGNRQNYGYTVVRDDGRLVQVMPQLIEEGHMPSISSHPSKPLENLHVRQKPGKAVALLEDEHWAVPAASLPRRKSDWDEAQSFHRHVPATATSEVLSQTELVRTSRQMLTTSEIAESRAAVDAINADLNTAEVQARVPLDAIDPSSAHLQLTIMTAEFFREMPVNRHIEAPTVRITSIRDPAGKRIVIPREEQTTMTLAEGIAVAQSIPGRDLIQWHKVNDSTALCIVDNLQAAVRTYISDRVNEVELAPRLVKPCFEVGFNGGTHPFAIRFKSIFIAKYLFHGNPVRVSLQRFGTAREGFPVFETIMQQIKKECLTLKSFHTASRLFVKYNEIACYLHPSTSRTPATEIKHPSAEDYKTAMEERLVEAQREIHIDNVKEVTSQREQRLYNSALKNGSAWAYRDEGIPLGKLRKMKMYLGLIPKGNKALYAARGDVDLKSPYQTSTITTIDGLLDPKESNLDQFNRGAAVLERRSDMTISEMHDKSELENETSTISNVHYVMSGDALEVGRLKRSMGLKRTGDKVPRFAPGFATQGVKEYSGAPTVEES